MPERIYTKAAGGRLESVEEVSFSSEDELQALIADHPELLDGQQMRPDDALRWILVTREQGIAEKSSMGDRWAVDLLLIDQEGVPTLAEIKRGSNPEIRRTAVGQLLEYAAHAAQTWDGTTLRHTFEATAASHDRDPGEVLGRLLRTDGEPNTEDIEEFWQRVATNLAAPRLRLLVVADDIPDSLRRTVEFLNRQMGTVEVLAVEIKQFEGASTQTLVPRVFGRTENASARKSASPTPKMTPQQFLEEFASAEIRDAADRLLKIGSQMGTASWGPSGVTIKAQCPLRQAPISVAWLYPPSKAGMGWNKTKNFTFGEGILASEAQPDTRMRALLLKWVAQFERDLFTEDVSSKGVNAWSVGYEAAAQNIDLLEKRLSDVLATLQRL